MDKTSVSIIRTLAALASSILLVYSHKRGRDWTPADPDESFIGKIL
ncbi:hypothetical protein TGAMA5MH_08660 [Trichoderma gamsii]|uniref:Uncharacterized protein n=1 Tax=Trichoderma gamsii TaxID=398673 RepID=A0A2K0T1Q7_9HYPO|nr:hypothetical protein TGAMA5MH_08660 [Trichoderma gamsii]